MTNTKAMTVSEFSLTTARLKAVEEHLFSNLEGEAVLLNLKNGKYYGLNVVGVAVWQRLQQPTTFAEIQSGILDEFAVTPEVCRREVLAFLTRMHDEELLELVDEKGI